MKATPSTKMDLQTPEEIVKQVKRCLPASYVSVPQKDNNGQYVRTIGDASARFDVFGNPPSRTW
jgi:hypothetical protein